jgi:hypothetical protein
MLLSSKPAANALCSVTISKGSCNQIIPTPTTIWLMENTLNANTVAARAGSVFNLRTIQAK